MRGMALYVSRHDGTAATCQDFVQAMEDAAKTAGDLPRFDFQQFRRWYSQAGTPQLQIERHWDGDAGTLQLTIRQSTPATPGQPQKEPVVIPLVLGLVGQGGDPLPLQLPGEHAQDVAAAQLPAAWGNASRLFVIDRPEQTLLFVGLEAHSHPPAVSLPRGFSAPVRIAMERPTNELLHLLACDSESFSRWDAGQVLLRQALLERAAGSINDELEEGLVAAFERILLEGDLGDSYRSALMAFPGLPELEDAALAQQGQVDPPALFEAALALRTRLGEELKDPLEAVLASCRNQWQKSWPEGVGDRDLTATVWSWRVAAGDAAIRAEAAEAVSGPSMTLARAGLRALQSIESPERSAALQAFHDRWQDKPVILDAWFGLEAATPFGDGVARVQQLLEHPRFDPAAPNSLRAVLGGFAGNVSQFHRTDGRGYRFMAEQIAAVDQRNPITASRMAKVFSRWQSYGQERSERMREALQQLSEAPLSPNSREVVDQCLQPA